MNPDITGNPSSSHCMGITVNQDFGEFVLYALNLDWRGGGGGLPSPEQAKTSALWGFGGDGDQTGEAFWKRFCPEEVLIVIDCDYKRAVIIRRWKKPQRAHSHSTAFQCCVWLKKYLHSLTKYAANSDVERKTVSRGVAGVPLWLSTCNSSQ